MTLQSYSERTTVCLALVAGIWLMSAVSAGAQTAVTLPNSGQTTTLTAAVAEQVKVTVPAAATFNVTNVSSNTSTGNLTVSAQNIVLTTATKQLRISLIANAAAFMPPVAGATTWSAADVSWTSGPGGGPNQWQNAAGSAGTLSSAAYTTVATCNADAGSCSSTGFKLDLAAKPTVKRSGSHTLTVTWKFESIGS
jgi:hypothetical protein